MENEGLGGRCHHRGASQREGRDPRSDSKCLKVPWKRIKGTGSKDCERSVNRKIKELTIWCKKIARQVQGKESAFVCRII